MQEKNTQNVIYFLNRLKSILKISTDVELSYELNVKTNVISNWKKRNTLDYELLFTYCVNNNIDLNLIFTDSESIKKTEFNIPVAKKTDNFKDGIPLITTNAMAGYFKGDAQVLEYECERFVVPVFKDAEFLISVRGSSMNSKYNSGDIVACKKLKLDTFFQWNKVYVIDTDQGALIKRIEQGSTEDTLLIVSDNPKYKTFELSKKNIYGIAIVIGVIRLE